MATFRGTHDLRQVDDVARAYLEESLSESEPARLLDASALLLYANTAVRWGVTSLTPAELKNWNKGLAMRLEDLLADVQPDTPHRRASLLDAIGHLGLHPRCGMQTFRPLVPKRTREMTKIRLLSCQMWPSPRCRRISC